LAAGSLDKPAGIKLIGHVYAADKGDYYRIDGSLPADFHPGSLGGVNPDPA